MEKKMSDYETHKGILRPTDLTKEDVVKEYLLNYNGTNKWILNDKNRVLQNKQLQNGTINEHFNDLDDQYAYIKNKVYTIHNNSFDGDIDLYIMEEKPNGELEYLVRFYNGGLGFGEALEEAAIRSTI
jgi:hypothetical protein